MFLYYGNYIFPSPHYEWVLHATKTALFYYDDFAYYDLESEGVATPPEETYTPGTGDAPGAIVAAAVAAEGVIVPIHLLMGNRVHGGV